MSLLISNNIFVSLWWLKAQPCLLYVANTVFCSVKLKKYMYIDLLGRVFEIIIAEKPHKNVVFRQSVSMPHIE